MDITSSSIAIKTSMTSAPSRYGLMTVTSILEGYGADIRLYKTSGCVLVVEDDREVMHILLLPSKDWIIDVERDGFSVVQILQTGE